jgi:hypothetical protein
MGRRGRKDSGSPVGRDHYRAIGVERSSSREEIRRAYLGRIKQAHPDVGPGLEEEARLLNEAWAVLSDPRRRAAYDAFLDGRPCSICGAPLYSEEEAAEHLDAHEGEVVLELPRKPGRFRAVAWVAGLAAAGSALWLVLGPGLPGADQDRRAVPTRPEPTASASPLESPRPTETAATPDAALCRPAVVVGALRRANDVHRGIAESLNGYAGGEPLTPPAPTLTERAASARRSLRGSVDGADLTSFAQNLVGRMEGLLQLDARAVDAAARGSSEAYDSLVIPINRWNGQVDEGLSTPRLPTMMCEA